MVSPAQSVGEVLRRSVASGAGVSDLGDAMAAGPI